MLLAETLGGSSDPQVVTQMVISGLDDEWGPMTVETRPLWPGRSKYMFLQDL